jgi:hypothetical protein
LSDVYLKAAYVVAGVLAIRHNESTANTTEALREVELATRSVERQLKYLADFQTWGEIVRSHGEKIAERSKKMRADLIKEIERLDAQLASLRSEPVEG